MLYRTENLFRERTEEEILKRLDDRYATYAAMSRARITREDCEAVMRTSIALGDPTSHYARLAAQELKTRGRLWAALRNKFERAWLQRNRRPRKPAPVSPAVQELYAAQPRFMPHRPRATDDYAQGISRVSWARAAQMRYVDLNPPDHVGWIIIDCDHGEVGRWKTAGLPEPSFITISPGTGRHHVVYELAAPVCRSDAARYKPQAYLWAVIDGLRRALGGDPAYNGILTKNPLHPFWETIWPPSRRTYALGQLAECIKCIKPESAGTASPRTTISRIQVLRRLDQAGVGERNKTLFDATRLRDKEMNPDPLAYVTQCNARLGQPLEYSEIKRIARSVERWERGKGHSPAKTAAFRAHQAARGRKGGRPKTTADTTPWLADGISRATWYRRQRQARLAHESGSSSADPEDGSVKERTAVRQKPIKMTRSAGRHEAQRAGPACELPGGHQKEHGQRQGSQRSVAAARA